MRFKEYLSEMQITDIDFSELKKVNEESYRYDFDVQGEQYTVSFDRHDHGNTAIWERSMTHNKAGKRTYAQTHMHKGQFEIIAIQFGCLKAFLKGLVPSVVLFTADKQDKNRADVYEKMLKRMDLQHLGYTYRRNNATDASVEFYVEKNS